MIAKILKIFEHFSILIIFFLKKSDYKKSWIDARGKRDMRRCKEVKGY